MAVYFSKYRIGLLAFAVPFYRSMLGFWVLALVFGGVFMEFKQHVLLGRFLFTHPLAFTLLPIGFLAYSGFHLRFQLNTLLQRNYLVFHQTGLLPFRDFAKNWLAIFTANHLILIGYFAFLSVFGIEKSAWISLSILWGTIVLPLAWTIWRLYSHLSKPLKESVFISLPWRGPVPRFTWSLWELRQNRPILLLLTKGASLLLLNGFFLSFRSGTYDHRWLEFGILCIAYFQIPLLLEKADFEFSRMSWFRSLPTPLSKKALNHLATLILVLLPELLFLFWRGGKFLAWEPVIALPLLLLSLTMALQALVYQYFGNSFVQIALGIFFLSFLLILFGIPWFLPALAASILFMLQLRSPFRL